MNDTILLAMSDDEFNRLVEDVLRSSRNKSFLALANSPLAQSSLVEDCFLEGETVSDSLRGRVMQAVLRWGIDELRPDGEHDWLNHQWRRHDVLFYPYIAGMTFGALANKMNVVEPTIFGRFRPNAITALARVLRRELKKPKSLSVRQKISIKARYARHSPDEQQLLKMSAVFGKPLAKTVLYGLAEQAEIANISASIDSLLTANLMRSLDEGAKVEVHPEIRTYLLPLLSPDESLPWHRAAAEHYEAQHDYLEAAYHFRRMGNQQGYQLAACILLEHQQAIINQEQVKELGDFLTQFRRHELPDRLWFKLKILAGDVVLATEKVEAAIAEYGQALAAKEIETKALAYYKRAQVYRRRNLNQALAHYAYCVKLLEASNSQLPLLTEIYIGRAWIFIQERQDLTQAEQYLERAQEILPDDRTLEARLHNAWAGLYAQRKDAEQEIEHRLQAWLAAEETQNLELRMKISKNLGFNYANLLQDYQQALKYLKHSQKLAIELADKQLEAMSLKDIGACYFWLGEYSQAIEYYQQAHTILVEAGNLNWQAALCYDLTEAYAEAKDIEQAKRYFEEGVTLAKKLGHLRYLREFEALARIYPGLPPIDADLNERQLKALEYVKKHGRITKKEYVSLIENDPTIENVKDPTPSRDLKDMCKKGFIVKKGGGRGTYYTQP